jgi:hypothetical protein
MKQQIRLFLLIIMFLFVLSPVHAETTGDRMQNGNAKERVQTKMQEGKEQVRTMVTEGKEALRSTGSHKLQDRCDMLTTRIDTRIARYTNNQSLPYKWGDRVINLLNEIIVKAQKEGLNTSELERVTSVFSQKVSVVKTAYSEFIAALKTTQSSACGESDGAFMTAISQARIELKQVQEAVVDLRHYYQTEVRPTLKNLRALSAQN